MRIFLDFGGVIAVPAVLAALLGKWLDERYQSAPIFLIICFGLAFIFTVFYIIKKTRIYAQEYEKLNQSAKKETDKTHPSV